MKVLFATFCLLLLIFPLVNFRIGIGSEIFPAVEIILVYCFASYAQMRVWLIFLIGIFFDQLYSMPIGTNSLVFITANLVLRFTAQFFLLKNYIINFMFFCCYCFFILNFRCLLISSKNLYFQSYLSILFQCLTTIFSYNLFRIPFDKSLEYLKNYAK